MKKIVIIGVVALVLILLGVYFIAPFASAKDDTLNCDVHVEIKNMNTGQIISGDVDLSSPSATDQFMMSFGQGIREVPLTDFTQSVSGLVATDSYTITMTAMVDYQTNNTSKADLLAIFSGRDGGAGGGAAMRTNNGPIGSDAWSSTVTLNTVALPNGNLTIHQPVAFAYREADNTPADGVADTIRGDLIPGSTLHLWVELSAWNVDSASADPDAHAGTYADLKIVSGATGTCSIMITGLTNDNLG
jgi:hypothetical protein